MQISNNSIPPVPEPPVPQPTIPGPFTDANDAAFEKFINENGEALRIAGEDHQELYTGTADMSNDQLVSLGVLGFDFAHNTLEEFKGKDYAVPAVGNDSTQFIEDAASKLFEATNTVKHVITNIDQLNEAYGGLMTNAANEFGAGTPEYEAAMDQYEAELIIPMAATLNVGVQPPVDYPDMQSVVTALQDELGEGIERMNDFIVGVREKIPELDGAAKMELLSHTLAITAAVTIGASVTIGTLAGFAEMAEEWNLAPPTGPEDEGVFFVATAVGKAASVFTAAGVDLGTALTVNDAVTFAEATTLDNFQAAIGGTWKDNVESSDSETFIAASDTFGREFEKFEKDVFAHKPVDWGHDIGVNVLDGQGEIFAYETAGTPTSGLDHQAELDIYNTMRATAAEVTEKAPRGITYIAVRPPVLEDTSGGDQFGVDYFEKGTIEIRAIINPVMPKGLDQPKPVNFGRFWEF